MGGFALGVIKTISKWLVRKYKRQTIKLLEAPWRDYLYYLDGGEDVLNRKHTEPINPKGKCWQAWYAKRTYVHPKDAKCKNILIAALVKSLKTGRSPKSVSSSLDRYAVVCSRQAPQTTRVNLTHTRQKPDTRYTLRDSSCINNRLQTSSKKADNSIETNA